MSYPLAAAIGLVVAVCTLPLSHVFPAAPSLDAFLGDFAVSVMGQRYFLGAPWGWPLLNAPALAAPGGTNIAMTDSIPLAMLLLKPWRTLLPAGFYVQQGWVALMMVLQPVAAVYALRSAGERRLWPCLAAAVLALCLPTWLLRSAAHVALSSQAAILLALGLYFRLVRDGGWRLWLLSAALLAACLLIHPYILAMVTALLAAVPLTLLLRGDRRGWGAGALVVTMAGGIRGVAALLDFGGTQPAPGFGYYSMNVLGPFLPQLSSLFPPLAVDATGGQMFEGMQYLGAGLLLLIGAAMVGWRVLPVRRHAGLLLILVGLTTFALSNEVYFGRYHLLHLKTVPAVLLQFRATGRFFWPVAYAGLIGAVAVVARANRPAVAGLVLGCACLLQIADTQTLRAGLGRTADHWSIDTERLAPVFAAHRALTLWPPFGCGAKVTDAPAMDSLLLASRTLMPTNTIFSARDRETATCDAAAVLSRAPQPGELRVLTRAGLARLVPDWEQHCRSSGPLVLCSAQDDALAGLPPIALPTLASGTRFGPTDPALVIATTTGWSLAAPQGVWTDGPEAVLCFNRPDGGGQTLRVVLEGMAIAPAPGGRQDITLTLNGRPVARWDAPDMTPGRFEADLPPGPADAVLALQIAQPTRPVDRGMNGDTRALGFLLQGFRLEVQPGGGTAGR